MDDKDEIFKKIDQLSPNNQTYILNTINDLLFSQEVEKSKNDGKGA